MRVVCPICKQPPELASMLCYKYAHYCKEVDKWWYTNGILWSTDQSQITGVSREPRNYHTRTGA